MSDVVARTCKKWEYDLYDPTRVLKIVNATEGEQFVYFGKKSNETAGLKIPPKKKVDICLCHLNNLDLRSGPLSDLRLCFISSEYALHRALWNLYHDVYIIDLQMAPNNKENYKKYVEMPELKCSMNMSVIPKEKFNIFDAGKQYSFSSCQCPDVGRKPCISSWQISNFRHDQYPHSFAFCLRLEIP